MTQHRTTAKKSRYLAVFEQTLLLKVISVAKVKPKDSEGWWIQGLKRVLKKRPTSTLAQKKQTKKMVNFPLERLCQPLNSSENMLSTTRKILAKEGSQVLLAKEFLSRCCIFFKSADFVLLQEIQPFLDLLHQSSNSIFDFNLRASFARLSFQVNKAC